MTDTYNKGTTVEWDWGNGTAKGEVQEKFTSRTTRQIDGNEVTRNADKDNPAYMIEQEDGGRVMKSHSELRKAG